MIFAVICSRSAIPQGINKRGGRGERKKMVRVIYRFDFIGQLFPGGDQNVPSGKRCLSCREYGGPSVP